MKSKEDIAREVLTRQLLEDFKSEITGENQTRVVGVNPEEAFFVGKLMSINDEEGKNKVFSSKTFIESISVDFYVQENQIQDAVIRIVPQGDFYYRAYPTLEEQRTAIFQSVYKTTNEKHNNYKELLISYQKNPETFVNTEIKLVPVYKKLSISEGNYAIDVKLSDVIDFEVGYGYIDEKHEINRGLTEHIESLMQKIQTEEDFYHFVVNEKTRIDHLTNEISLQSFINS